MSLAATYVDADTFTVSGDYTADFAINRKVRANCGVDGLKYGVVLSSSYTAPNTTVNLTADSDDLTANLTEVDWSVVKPGAAGNIPLHAHSSENSGGSTINPSIVQAPDANGLKLYEDGGAGIFVKDGGNVGIGTTGPLYALDVASTNVGAMTSLALRNTSDTAISSARMLIAVGGTSAADPFIRFDTSGLGNVWAVGLDNSDGDSFKISNGNTLGSGDKLTITTGGNVGIGTTGPGALLEVAGSSGNFQVSGVGNQITFTGATTNYIRASNAVGALRFRTGGDTDRMTILAGGDVGIGTTGPDRLLHPEVSDAVTGAVTYAQRLSHITSGTAAAGFGVGLEMELEDDGGTNRVASYLETLWNDPATAAYKADALLKVVDSAATREILRGRATGAAAAIGFLGASPVVRQAHIADPTDLATCITAVTSTLAALESYGLLATS